MKKILFTLVAAASIAAQADTLSTRYEYDMGKGASIVYRQCNNNDVDKTVEVGVIEYTADRLDSRRATEFIVTPPIARVGAGECQNFRVIKLSEVGVRVFHLDVATFAADKVSSGNSVEIEPRLQPVLFVGNEPLDRSRLTVKLTDQGIVVSNTGKRPGRIIRVAIDDQKFDLNNSWNVLPGQSRTISLTPEGVKNIRDAVANSKKVVFIDRVGQEISM